MLMGDAFARRNAAFTQPTEGFVELKHKQVPMWGERFGWACVIMWSDLWKELPIEINKMIVNLLVETHWKCRECEVFVKELPFEFMYCSKECGNKRYGRSTTVLL